MKRCRVSLKKVPARRWVMLICVTVIVFSTISVFAQDGVKGIQEADTKVRGYFKYGVSLMYAIGAMVGLIGAVKVYQKWSQGEQDTSKVASAWFGACIFLVVVATIISSFFGVSVTP